MLTSSKRLFALPSESPRSSMEDSRPSSSSASGRPSYQSLSTKPVNPVIIITPPGEPFPCLSNVSRRQSWFIDAETEELAALRNITKKPLAPRPKPPPRPALEEIRPADMNVIIKRAMRSGALTRSVWGKPLASRPPPIATLPEDIETPLACASLPDLREALTPPGLDTSHIATELSTSLRRLSMTAPGSTVCDGRTDDRLHSWSFGEDEDASYIHISLDDVPASCC